ncbi:MAG: SUF system NifU family Fe-S cluster assembly protein [SAR202 cluster bacterium]|nr:SUF system NifU family Fe-S cluster assembly protein [SAR202 cluster bacterium]
MTDLQDLYQEIVMDHNWKPRNFHKMETPTCSSHGFNPFCGDTITVYASIAEEIITDVSFEAAGCSISKASASMMTEAVKGLTITDAKTVFSKFHELVTQTGNAYEDDASLGDLVVLAGVRAFPTRIKCATLSWHALKGALEDEDTVSTE